jgi:hypothetical protein
VIDGRPVSSGLITHISRLSLSIDDHHEEAPFFVTKLGAYPLVLGIPWMQLHDIGISFASNSISFNSKYCMTHCGSKSKTVAGIEMAINPNVSASPINISFIGAAPFSFLARKKKCQILSISLNSLNKSLEDTEIKENWKEKIPEEYHQYLDMFDEVLANSLPPHRPYDHRINLQPGKEPPFGPLYGMSRNELTALKKFLEENLDKGFIRASNSPAAAPILFVKKSDGTLRLCVDYRGINEITIKNRYPLPLIQETLARLAKANWYTTLDLRGAFNLVRMAEGEEWKTAFRTRYGLFESLVMPFGLTNAPATFQHFINDVLRNYLDVFCSAYLDDIIIYSETLEEHRSHVKAILDALKSAGINLNPVKCHFHVKETKYLGLIISPDGISMDPAKLSAISDWESPKSVKDVQIFLGFANFYRRFILGYSKIVAPLTALTKKGIKFQWTSESEAAFQNLKRSFTSAPILKHFDPEGEIVVETDASDYVSAGVLSQYDDQGILHPVAFFSKKHSPAECNYEIYDKELLAIIRCFEEWRPHLESAKDAIKVLSDHKNLEYFMSTKLLNRRQARWSEFLSRFNFKITYRPGKAGGKPDALTRRSTDLPQEGDERLLNQAQTVLKRENLSLLANTLTDSLDEMFKQAYTQDPFPNKILELLASGANYSREISLAECENLNERLIFRKTLFVPAYDPLRLELLRLHHEIPAAGHPGRAKTFELLSRDYYWSGMRKDVEKYIRNCHTCQRAKTPRHSPFGTLKPLPVPYQNWKEVSMDFVTGLPESNGFNAILVVVDRLSKMRHLIPCRDSTTSKDLAQIYLEKIWVHHGNPDSITSDRGPQFTSEFWRSLCELQGINLRLSTAFHPQTDGQTERLNGVMEQYLRCFVSYQQDDWVKWLPLAEVSANDHVSETTGYSPFQANYGFCPRFRPSPLPTTLTPQNADSASFVSAMQKIQDHLRAEMRLAQDIQETHANRHRIPAPRFNVGDEVWLSSRNIKTSRPCVKLDFKRLGKFKIVDAIGSHAYRLDLPPTMKIHPVFHVSLLEKAASDPLPGQIAPAPPPIIVEGEEEWEVEEILDSRLFHRAPQYLVSWLGYDENTWQPASDVENSPDLVRRFHQKYPHKPGPW